MKGISPYASSLLPPSPTFDLRLITTDCQPIYLIVFYQLIHYQDSLRSYYATMHGSQANINCYIYYMIHIGHYRSKSTSHEHKYYSYIK